MRTREVIRMTKYPNIKSMIDGRGLKMKFVANSLGWHPSKLSQIIGGHRRPKPAELSALARFLNQPPEIFLNQMLACSKRADKVGVPTQKHCAGLHPQNINITSTKSRAAS